MAIYLLPTYLGVSDNSTIFTAYQLDIIQSFNIFVAENLRTARRDLRSMGFKKSFEDVEMYEISKHSPADLPQHIIQKHKSENIALLSEAGIPAVADPGNALVLEAQKFQIRCVPLVGPSSIFLALMASGLNGQNFAFNGYLPIEKSERKKAILFFEKRSHQEKQTQIFIETPFRNNQLFADFLSTLSENTLLTLAIDLTTEQEYIVTKSVKDWKKNPRVIGKNPAIFLFLG